jgi:hypothetical protein
MALLAALGGTGGSIYGASRAGKAHPTRDALLGALAGGSAGAGAGELINRRRDEEDQSRLYPIAGGLGGAALGAGLGAKLSADNALPAAYFTGAKAACDRFKVGFAGLAAGLAGLATKAAPLASKALKNPTIRSLGAQAGGGAAMQAGMNAMAPKQPQ